MYESHRAGAGTENGDQEGRDHHDLPGKGRGRRCRKYRLGGCDGERGRYGTGLVNKQGRGQHGGDGQSPFGQALTQQLSAAFQSTSKGAEATAQSCGRFFAWQPVQTTYQQRQPITLWQTDQLFVDESDQLAAADLGQGIGPIGSCLSYRLVPGGKLWAATGADLFLACQPVGHCVQPAFQRQAGVEPRGLANQGEEGGLEDVFGRMAVSQSPAGHAQHQRTMSVQQLREGRFVVQAGKAIQEVAVAGPAVTPDRVRRSSMMRLKIRAVVCMKHLPGCLSYIFHQGRVCALRNLAWEKIRAEVVVK